MAIFSNFFWRGNISRMQLKVGRSLLWWSQLQWVLWWLFQVAFLSSQVLPLISKDLKWSLPFLMQEGSVYITNLVFCGGLLWFTVSGLPPVWSLLSLFGCPAKLEELMHSLGIIAGKCLLCSFLSDVFLSSAVFLLLSITLMGFFFSNHIGCKLFFLTISQSFIFTNEDLGVRCWGENLAERQRKRPANLPQLVSQEEKNRSPPCL